MSLLRWTTSSLMSATAVGTGLAAVTLPFAPPLAAVGAAMAGAGAMLATPRGRTLPEWAWRRYNAKGGTLEHAVLYKRKETGLVWDGTRASLFIEVTSPPYAITVIGGGNSTPTRLPLEGIRDQLDRFGVTCEVDVLQLQHRFGAPDRAAEVHSADIANVGTPLGGRTVIVVSVALERSLDAVTARSPRAVPEGEEPFPIGVANTVELAGARVCRTLRDAGLRAAVMTSQQVWDFTVGVASQTREAVELPKWDKCGEHVFTVSHVVDPQGWNEGSRQKWTDIRAHRTLTSIHLRPTARPDTTDAEMFVSFLTTDASTVRFSESAGLRNVTGQQLQVMSRMFPAAVSQKVAVQPHRLTSGNEFGMDVPGFGAGLYLGTGSDNSKVFLSLRGDDTGTPLYLIGPAFLHRQMVWRASTGDRRIAVDVVGAEWDALIARRRSPLLSRNGTTDAPIVVTTPERAHMFAEPGRVVFAVTEDTPPVRPTFSVVITEDADGNPHGVVTSKRRQVAFGWWSSRAEQTEVGQ